MNKKTKKIKIALVTDKSQKDYFDVANKVIEYLDPENYLSELIDLEKGDYLKKDFKDQLLLNDWVLMFLDSIREKLILEEIIHQYNVPYLGPSLLLNTLSLNRFLSLDLLRIAGFKIPHLILVPKIQWLLESMKVLDKAKFYVGYPLLIGRNYARESVKVPVRNEDELVSVLDDIFQNEKEIILEPFLNTKVFRCAVFDHGSKESSFVLEPVEVLPNQKISELKKISPPAVQLIKKTARAIHYFMDYPKASVIDLTIDRFHQPFVLENHPLSGFGWRNLLSIAEYNNFNLSKLLNILLSMPPK